ncbi:SNase-domain-containing protein [Cryphonectria parasitica EP155]|uniref:Probable endonuclease LCL3 n=1 Tax=Cryphonectria parasitica (strain ATCC 38755 / EP155) TaxID=660469 RepID=A0A9P4Y9Z0_CRYP1|nr:SNase-domain-containing protein [Cryphonectria parasitica EP155]KAF3769196.1 SNase-domain-containing protein [Cryphonectria parasitica EP155]
MPWPWQSGWNDSLNVVHFKDPRSWIPAFAITTVLFGGLKFYRTYLRRIPSIEYVLPHYYRKRRLFGKVTSVGDGDGFHLFHTPGGRWAGWGWLRKVPTERKALKGNTIPIRLAGVDAPEGAHFGRTAQPYATESLEWLQNRVLNRRVRAVIWRRDQYDRAVATVYIRRLFFFRSDVGLEMIHQGLATSYEAKTGAEFGGEAMEKKYKAAEAEAKRKKIGLWKPFETPREYKDRMREAERAEKG